MTTTDTMPPPPMGHATPTRTAATYGAAPITSFDSRRGWRHRAHVDVWPDRVVLRRRYWLPAANRYATVIVPFDEVRAVTRAGTMAGRHDVTLHTGAVTVTVSTGRASAADHLVAAAGAR